MLCEHLLFLIPALVGLIFTIVEKGIPRWEFSNWTSLAKEAANPIVETWGSKPEQRFDLIVLDNHLHLPPHVIWTPPIPPPEFDLNIGYFSWIFTKLITKFSQLRSILNITLAIATVVTILVVCLGATILRLHRKKQSEKSYFTSLIQFMKIEAANGVCEMKSVSDRLHWFISAQEARIFESMVVLMFEQEKNRRMNSELTTKKERIQDLKSALRDLGIEKSKVEDKSARQATAIQQLSANLAEVQTKRKNAEDKSKLLESNMATAAAKAESRILSLQVDAERLLELIASQWSQLDDARAGIDSTNKKVVDLTLELSKRTQEISAKTKLMESNMAIAAAKAESKILFLKADAERLLELIASQWTQLDDARAGIDSTNQQVADLTLELSKRTEEVSTINVSLDNASYRIEEVEKSATELQSKVARRDATILQLKSEATNSEKDKKILQAATIESEARALEQKSKLKDENLRAILAKEDRESELITVRKETAAAASQVSKGQKEIQKLKREVDELSKKLVGRDELASKTHKEKAAIEASLVEALDRVAEEGANIRKKDEKYFVLESEMKEAKRDFQTNLAKEKNRLQVEHQQLESEMLDKHTAKMAVLKAKYEGIFEDTEARVKALEEENTRLGDARDAQIAALNAEHGDIVKKVSATFAGELNAVEDQKQRLKEEKKAVAEELASMTTALNKEKAEKEAKAPAADKKTARIIGDLQASLATAGREVQEWRTEAYIAIVRRMPPTQRGLSLFNMDSRNFPGSHQRSAPPLDSRPSPPAGPSGQVNAVSNSFPPNPPPTLPPSFPIGPSRRSNPTTSLPAGPSSGQSNTNSNLPPRSQAFAGLNPAAGEFRAPKDTKAT